MIGDMVGQPNVISHFTEPGHPEEMADSRSETINVQDEAGTLCHDRNQGTTADY